MTDDPEQWYRGAMERKLTMEANSRRLSAWVQATIIVLIVASVITIATIFLTP